MQEMGVLSNKGYSFVAQIALRSLIKGSGARLRIEEIGIWKEAIDDDEVDIPEVIVKM